MKAITLHQPWATLVAIGAKRIETRSWNTNYRGPLAIHAGRNTKYIRGFHKLTNFKIFSDALKGAEYFWGDDIVPLGAVVATCNLVHVQLIDDAISFPACKSYAHRGKEWSLDDREHCFGNYEVGRYIWLLDDIRILSDPISAKGSQGFWEWER